MVAVVKSPKFALCRHGDEAPLTRLPCPDSYTLHGVRGVPRKLPGAHDSGRRMSHPGLPTTCKEMATDMCSTMVVDGVALVVILVAVADPGSPAPRAGEVRPMLIFRPSSSSAPHEALRSGSADRGLLAPVRVGGRQVDPAATGGCRLPSTGDCPPGVARSPAHAEEGRDQECKPPPG